MYMLYYNITSFFVKRLAVTNETTKISNVAPYALASARYSTN